MDNFESLFNNYMSELCKENPDPSHDILHVQRVVKTAKRLSLKENANLDVVVPAAYLHDCVYVSKTDSRRKHASKLSADRSLELLRTWGYPEKYFQAIHHAILTHSFSADIKPESLEAKIVQDADRLDAIGAVGVIRCFGFSGLSLRPFYKAEDPFCAHRTPDDRSNILDHFFVKLLRISEQLHTEAAKQEAVQRTSTMKDFLQGLRAELG